MALRRGRMKAPGRGDRLLCKLENVSRQTKKVSAHGKREVLPCSGLKAPGRFYLNDGDGSIS